MEVTRELLSAVTLSDTLSEEAAAAAPPGEAPGGDETDAAPPSPLSAIGHRERRQLFERQLRSAPAAASASETVIDMRNLRALASSGLPECTRAVAWKLLLGYLPARRGEWAATLKEKRSRYAEFCATFVKASPASPTEGGGGEEDHPLSQAPDSRWGSYFKDADLIAQISRDVERTHPGMHFFGGGGGEKRTKKTKTASRRSEMARALLVFAKLNPGLAYVQGMNEVLAPLYYHCALEEMEEEGGEEGEEEEAEEEETKNNPLLSSSSSSSLPAPPALFPPSHAEADSFWCLVSLMADFRDNFCAELDRSAAGVAGSLARVERALREADAELAAHVLDANGVSPHFFAFRWVSLLLTQEFELPEVARLWDYLLAVSGGGDGGSEGVGDERPLTRPEALARLCAAMLLRARAPLLRGDFAANLKLLQRYPPALTDVAELVAIAGALPAGVGRGGGGGEGEEGKGGAPAAAVG